MPAKFLTLMNPRGRRRSRRRLFGAAAAAHARKMGRRTHRRRRVRRNPAVARRRSRPSPPKMTPAMRAKISRAVKASFRRRAAGGGAVARRSARPVRRLYGAALAASQGRRIGRRRFSASASLSSFKSMVSKPLLLKAGGAVGASFITGYVLARWGGSLPMASNKWGRLAYSVAIPFAGAYLVRKKSRDLAEGMVIGGLVMGINALLQTYAPSVAATAGVTATGAFAASGPSAVMFPSNRVAGELGAMAYYPKRSGSLGTPARNRAFKTSAWAR